MPGMAKGCGGGGRGGRGGRAGLDIAAVGSVDVALTVLVEVL